MHLFITFPIYLIGYVTKEAQDTPMDMNTSTDRNATTLFFGELVRGIKDDLYFVHLILSLNIINKF